jgi:outer membrane protein TolC
MRKLYLTLLVALSSTVVQAQSQTFTLDQCIEYALANNINLQNSMLDEQSAVARVKEITGLGLPQVNGAVNLVHNQKLPRFFGRNIVTANNPDAFGFFNDIPGAADGDIVAGQNFFQLKSSGNASLTINQLIFNGSYFVGLQAAKALKELSYKNTVVTKVNVVDQVTKAYYYAIINKERITLFNSNINRVDTLLQNTIAMNKSGFAEDIDVDRLRVTLNNLKTERGNFIDLQALSIELLKFQMNYPIQNTLEISGDISSLNPVVDPNSYKTGWDYVARPDYQVLEVNRKLQTLNIKNYRSQALPTIGAYANLGYSTQSADIGGLFKTNSSGVENTEFYGPDKWYDYSSFGLSVNIPIFSGFQLKHKTQQEKVNLLKIENGMKQLKQGIDIEIKTSLIAYQNALRTMESQKQNMDLSAKVARVTKIKYEQGVGSNLELLDAENTLKQSQVNYYNAMYDVIVAKINLDKAYGKLLPENKTN